MARSAGDEIVKEVADWLGKISDDLHGKLADAGLVNRRAIYTLGEWCEKFTRTAKVKESTRTQLRIASENLKAYFGADRQMRSIQPEDADAYGDWLRNDKHLGLGENTARRRIGRAKQILTQR